MKLDIFQKREKRLLGIDIGSKSIKLVELEQRPADSYSLVNYAIAVVQGLRAQSDAPEAVADILTRIIKEAEIETRAVTMSLPAYATFMAMIKLPALSGQELAEAIEYEAKKYVPATLSEVTLGWSQVGQEILLIAVPKTLSFRYAQIASLAKLELAGLEAETFSLARALAKQEKGTIIIIDMGAYSVNVSLIRDGQIRFNHTIDRGVFSLPQVIAIAEKSSQPISKFILTGGEASAVTAQELKTLAGAGSTAEIGSPWQGVIYPPELAEYTKQLAPILAGAIGVAKRNYVND